LHQGSRHWYTREYLSILGAEPATARVVEDRNRVTPGDATASIPG
jgi:hypothetical protein